MPRKESLRVAALIDAYAVTGPGRQLAAIVEPLATRGIELRPFVMQQEERSKAPYRDYLESLAIPHSVIASRGRVSSFTLQSLREALGQFAPHVLQSHSYRPSVFISIERVRGSRTPWIGFFHGLTYEDAKVRLYQGLERQLFRMADHVVVVAPSQQTRFAFARRISFVQNAVIAQPTSARPAKVLVNRVGPLVLSIGRLSHEKGFDVLIRSWSAVRASLPNARLLIAGEGPARIALEEEVAGCPPGSVTLLGARADIGDLLAQAELVVLPSRSEGMPNVLLEALAADVPVVSTRVGAVEQVLLGGKAGRIVEPDNPEQLAEAIVNAISGNDRLTFRKGRARAAAAFSLEARADALARLYESIISRQPSAG